MGSLHKKKGIKEKSAKWIKGKKVTVHSKYGAGNDHSNDIALIKLKKSVSSKYALKLCKKSYKKYTIASCGLGQTESGRQAERLQEVRLRETYSKCPVSPGWSKSKQVIFVYYSAINGHKVGIGRKKPK